MERLDPSGLGDYGQASVLEWLEADGVGGVSSSSVLNANTRKQHAILSALGENGQRCVLVANLQDSLRDGDRSYDLATNAYVGAVHPQGFQSLVSFTNEPWPTWRYRFGDLEIEKQVVAVRGEHTVVAVYTLHGPRRATLDVRPLLAFRGTNELRHERDAEPDNWHTSYEFIECRPFDGGPSLYISHSEAKVEAVSLWYRQFLYERDRESKVECVEDLYHPGRIEMPLTPGTAVYLVFSTPSPRPVTMAQGYLAEERARRTTPAAPEGGASDPLFERLAKSAERFVYERLDGVTDIMAGLPWNECDRYRGLIAMPGLLLAPGRFELAKAYLEGVVKDWNRAPSPRRFSPDTEAGQMLPADTPLWVFPAVWRYWYATKDKAFVGDVLFGLLQQIADSYSEGDETRVTDQGLIEIGYGSGAKGLLSLPLGTNALWYNALATLAVLGKALGISTVPWCSKAEQVRTAFHRLFACTTRLGFANSAWPREQWRDESLRASQVLTVGLPFSVSLAPGPVVEAITEHLATPYGLRTLSLRDSRYVGDGTDVRLLPKHWSGSVDPTWLGCYCDGLRHAGMEVGVRMLTPFRSEFERRGLEQISGAFTGAVPHDACDYVASASALGEYMRVYAREVLRAPHVV